MTDRRRPVLERIFWICVFLLSLFSCGRFINDAWNKWEENPVIINYNQKSTYVLEVPFPAITICPETKTRRKIFNYTEMSYIAMSKQFDMDNDEYSIHF